MAWLSWLRRRSRSADRGHLLIHEGNGLYLAESPDLKSHLPLWHLARWRRVASSPRTKRLWPVLPLLLLWLFTIFLSSRRPSIPQYGPHSKDAVVLDPTTLTPKQQKLVIVLPVDRPGHDLCKVLSSAVALGYPPPVLVNWRKDFDTDNQGIGPSHLAKVSGTLDFLDYALANDTLKADRLDDNDLVLMMDALDIWFQLPPEILLRRYYGIIQSSNRRLAHSSELYDGDYMEQTTIAAAQKGCMGPRDPYSQLHCSELPTSTVPNDVYGIYTEFPLFGWKWRRPRYLNSGSVMGPAKDMRKYFARIRAKMDKHAHMGEELGGDQGVFSEVYGEQESWRRSTLMHDAQKGVAVNPGMSSSKRDAYEYHLTLDYTQELFYPTGYSENDAAFTVLGDRGAKHHPVGMASDIEAIDSPLKALKGVSPTETKWNHKSLFVDFWMASIPVAIHHNAWRHGLKKRRQTWWDRMWYFPYLRPLLEMQSQEHTEERRPLWTTPAKNGTLEVVPYGSGKEKLSALTFTKKTEEDGGWGLKAAGWSTTCAYDDEATEARKPWHEEVFRDGKGAFGMES